jgi:hypothetical protein
VGRGNSSPLLLVEGSQAALLARRFPSSRVEGAVVTHPNEAHYHFTHSLPDLLRLTNDFFVGRLCALAAAAVGSTARCVALGQLISRRSRAGDGAESPGGGACLQQPRSGAAGGAERDEGRVSHACVGIESGRCAGQCRYLPLGSRRPI